MSMSKKITIIDYGTSNLRSVTKAFIKVDADIIITNDHKEIENADKLVLPGVGSFGNGMHMLDELNIIDSINLFVKKGNPFLGICLGMQMLLDGSEEDNSKKGLKLIDGQVRKIPTIYKNKTMRKIPHIGWSKIDLGNENKIFSNISSEDYFYFVHSFMSLPDDPKKIIATCDYNNFKVTAAISDDNIIGMQFHPEISSKSGLKVINNFLELY